ncbi:MAG: RNA polymerase sigma factor [Candidatus Hydrogenedentes bacterium]|nr:RNA polymerase sigma factor [Candidatus Hydrogenedentota bacterium]
MMLKKILKVFTGDTGGTVAVYPHTAEKEEHISDVELVKKAQKGDLDAFSELVRKYQTIVYNLAYRFMRDKNLAEDMAQESFVKAYKHLSGFRGDCAFATWLYRVTCTVCITELNRRKRHNEFELQSNIPETGYEEKHSDKEIAEKIRECVKHLPPKYATVITLYYLNGMAYEEIAEVMDIPVGTLKTWMFRARKQLRRIVEREIFFNEENR